MACYEPDAPGKVVVDSIHGDIPLTRREVQVIDTPSFQRLRRLKQLAMSQMAYPNATHTRFAHSLGALATMQRILQVVRRTARISLSYEQEEDLRLAALLHDIGHYPYSHLVERLDKVTLTEEYLEGATRTLDRTTALYPEHDLLGTSIVTKQPDLLEALGGEERAKSIANLFGPKRPRADEEATQLSKLVHSSLDMDRLDYLLRDSQATGVPYGRIDINYLLNNLEVSPSGMVGISEKAIPAAEQFLLARFFMHRTVYHHKTTFGMEEACRQLLRRLRDLPEAGVPRDAAEIKEIVTSDKLAAFTDAYVDQIIQKAASSADPVISALAGSIQGRRPPKLLYEVNILASASDANKHHAGSAFKKECKHNLGVLADRSRIPLEQFILCETPPVRLEKRGPLVRAEEVRPAHLEEEEEELIKVFVCGQEEPRSLVDIPYSLVSRCGGLFFQSFRLYVVYDGSDRESVVDELKREVIDWEKT